tara:strand:- start:94 stop:444 length:351 start_codon:yes stop_codon:yes gene_type:complete
MLKLLKTIDYADDYGDSVDTVKVHKVEGTVKLAMDGIWGYDGPEVVNVKEVKVVETQYTDDDPALNESYKNIHVLHDTDWRIYTDSGFEKAISEFLGYGVHFTEQGMQDNFRASME